MVNRPALTPTDLLKCFCYLKVDAVDNRVVLPFHSWLARQLNVSLRADPVVISNSKWLEKKNHN